MGTAREMGSESVQKYIQGGTKGNLFKILSSKLSSHPGPGCCVGTTWWRRLSKMWGHWALWALEFILGIKVFVSSNSGAKPFLLLRKKSSSATLNPLVLNV